MTERQTRRRFVVATGGLAAVALAGCTGDDSASADEMDDGSDEMDDGSDGMDDGSDEMDSDAMSPTDPAEAPVTSVDRFSEAAGTLLVRSEANDLPGPDEPVDFDQGPFLTQGFGPDGEVVEYYNFDVMPRAPAPIYSFRYENGDPVEDQLNIVDVKPGDAGYSDFWLVNLVTVPDDYEANTITSVDDLLETDYDIETTETIKNCPVVPAGSTATRHHGDENDGAPVVEGWYDGEVVPYFLFEEDSYSSTDDGGTPVSPIYVTFNVNLGQDGGGPPSGFMTEEGSDQTHNVVATLPGDETYSPLWSVNIYDNADFEAVSNLSSATDASLLESAAANVNCPVVSVDR